MSNIETFTVADVRLADAGHMLGTAGNASMRELMARLAGVCHVEGGHFYITRLARPGPGSDVEQFTATFEAEVAGFREEEPDEPKEEPDEPEEEPDPDYEPLDQEPLEALADRKGVVAEKNGKNAWWRVLGPDDEEPLKFNGDAALREWLESLPDVASDGVVPF